MGVVWRAPILRDARFDVHHVIVVGDFVAALGDRADRISYLNASGEKVPHLGEIASYSHERGEVITVVESGVSPVLVIEPAA